MGQTAKDRVIVTETHRDGKGRKKKVTNKEYVGGKKVREKVKKYHRD